MGQNRASSNLDQIQGTYELISTTGSDRNGRYGPTDEENIPEKQSKAAEWNSTTILPIHLFFFESIRLISLRLCGASRSIAPVEELNGARVDRKSHQIPASYFIAPWKIKQKLGWKNKLELGPSASLVVSSAEGLPPHPQCLCPRKQECAFPNQRSSLRSQRAPSVLHPAAHFPYLVFGRCGVVGGRSGWLLFFVRKLRMWCWWLSFHLWFFTLYQSCGCR